MTQRLVLIMVWFSPFLYTYAQESDSTALSGIPEKIYSDISSKKSKRKIKNQYWDKRFNPRSAFLYSLLLPGAGQVYNKKYWKVPIVYGGLVGGAFLINYFQNQYFNYKQDFQKIIESNGSYNPPSNLTEDQLRQLINESKRSRDLFTMITVLWYFLQAVEAHVNAHLIVFKLNPELQVSINPYMNNPSIPAMRNTGIALTMRF